jgi:hypothetical protein
MKILSLTSAIVASLALNSALAQTVEPQPTLHNQLQTQQFSLGQSVALPFGSGSDNLSAEYVIAEGSQPTQGFYVLDKPLSNGKVQRFAGSIYHTPEHTIYTLQNAEGNWVKVYQTGNRTKTVLVNNKYPEPLRMPATAKSVDMTQAIQWRGEPSTPRMQADAITTDTASDSSIDTLILFDPRLPAYMAENDAVFDEDIEYADAVTNFVYEQSELSLAHRIVGAHPIVLPSTENDFVGAPSTDILDELVNSGMASRLRDQYNADVIHYIGVSDDVCGQAYVASDIAADNTFFGISPDFHVAFTTYQCLGTGTFPHELGHNIGLLHDRYTLDNNEQGSGSQIDNHIPYGYVDPDGEFYTIMAYGSSCREVAPNGTCSREALYSSPDLDINGTPAGKSEAEVDAANAAKATTLTTPWTRRFQRWNDYLNVGVALDGGSVQLQLPDDSVSEYVVVNRNCHSNRYFTQQQIENGETITGSTLTGTIEPGNLGICVLVPSDDNGYQLIGEFSASVSSSGGNDAFIFTDSNVLTADVGDAQSFTVLLSDDSILNSNIELATYFDESMGRPSINEGIAQASEWFDVSVSGSGAERTLTITPKRSQAAIAAELADTDQRNVFQLPLRVVNTNFSEFSVSSMIWWEGPANSQTPVTGYLTQGYEIISDESVSLSAELVNVPADVTPAYSIGGDVSIDNLVVTQTNRTTTPQGDVITLSVEGDATSITDTGTVTIVADLGVQGAPNVTIPIRAYSNNQPAILSFTASSDTILEDEPFTLTVTLNEPSDTSFYDTLTVEQRLPGRDNVVFEPTRSDGNVFEFDIPGQASGAYDFVASVNDGNGNSVMDTISISVEAIEPIVVDAMSFSPSSVRAGGATTATITTSGNLDLDTTDWSVDDSSVTISNEDLTSARLSFSEQGTYTVSVTVTDTAGNTDTFEETIDVAAAPTTTTGGSSGGGSSGGSTGWLMLLLLAGLGGIKQGWIKKRGR